MFRQGKSNQPVSRLNRLTIDASTGELFSSPQTDAFRSTIFPFPPSLFRISQRDEISSIKFSQLGERIIRITSEFTKVRNPKNARCVVRVQDGGTFSTVAVETGGKTELPKMEIVRYLRYLRHGRHRSYPRGDSVKPDNLLASPREGAYSTPSSISCYYRQETHQSIFPPRSSKRRGWLACRSSRRDAVSIRWLDRDWIEEK